ncbi:hypothetical protein AAG906_000696 [Vitis piasezkii]
MNPIQVKFKSFQVILKLLIPKNVQDVLRVSKWKNVVLEEIRVLEKNKTWEIENLSRRKITVGCKWRYKTRLVAKGFTQTYGINYLETFALVPKLNTVRILLSLAATLDWPL